MDNFYTNEIKDYNTNYESAITKIDKIISTMENLRTSFNSASGNDITAIRNDIDSLIAELQEIRTTIVNKKNTTNTNATNSDKVYKDAIALPNTPTFKSNDYVYESIGNKKVYIRDGIIHWNESFRQIPVSSYNGLFGGVAAIGKLLNSYPIIINILQANVPAMLEGRCVLEKIVC